MQNSHRTFNIISGAQIKVPWYMVSRLKARREIQCTFLYREVKRHFVTFE